MLTSQFRPMPSRMCPSMNGGITRVALSRASMASAARMASSRLLLVGFNNPSPAFDRRQNATQIPRHRDPKAPIHGGLAGDRVPDLPGGPVPESGGRGDPTRP